MYLKKGIIVYVVLFWICFFTMVYIGYRDVRIGEIYAKSINSDLKAVSIQLKTAYETTFVSFFFMLSSIINLQNKKIRTVYYFICIGLSIFLINCINEFYYINAGFIFAKTVYNPSIPALFTSIAILIFSVLMQKNGE